MGHATIEMTLRYSHLSPEVGRNAVQLQENSDPAVSFLVPLRTGPIRRFMATVRQLHRELDRDKSPLETLVGPWSSSPNADQLAP